MPLIAVIPTQKVPSVLDETLGENLRKTLPVARIIYTQEQDIFTSFNVTSPEWQKKYNYTPYENDVFLFCHDDIEIISTKEFNYKIVNEIINNPKIGFVGLAGTSKFDSNLAWWQANPQSLKGIVYHKINGNIIPTLFGPSIFPTPQSRVDVLDGVFLMAAYRTLQKINLEKPKAFTGNWDFYDIYYTYQTTKFGFDNLVCNISIIHDSPGIPRSGWHNNKIAFNALCLLDQL
jgi:hypothetical protein